MSAPTLFFCIGAAKCGTSWLYEALVPQAGIHLRGVKELHYFDGFDLDTRATYAASFAAQRRALQHQINAGRLVPEALDRKTRRMRDLADAEDLLGRAEEDTSAYLAYLTEGQGAAHVVGDLTPAYALLCVERFRSMAGLSDDVRFLYVLRDPVDRLWSHVRMIAARRAGKAATDFAARAGRILTRTLRGKESQIEHRSDYAGTLARLYEAIQPTKRLVMFYEDIIGPDGLKPLARFLGLGAFDAVPARVHASPALAMTQEQRAAAAAWLRPQYDYVADTLGPVPGQWRLNMAEV